MVSKPTFIVVHTAKDVEYSIEGFRIKNKDEIQSLVVETIRKSQSQMMREMFENVGKGSKFLGSKIRNEMKQLMDELNSSDCHFIRCIKPNELKKPGIFFE